MGRLRRMYTCLPSFVSLVFITLPVLMTAMKLNNNDIRTVDVTDYGGVNFTSETDAGQQPSYRLLNKIDGSIYFGGNESLIRVFLDSETKMFKSITTTLVTTNATQELVLSCTVLNSKTNETVCWNFIRVVEKLNQPDNELLVCGTNAFHRLCYRCNTTDLLEITCTPGTVPQLNLVPKLPDIRPSSAVFGPSPGDMDDVLFAALTGDDSTLQKYRVPLEGDPVFELDTVTVGGRFIQKDVVFVGRPFEYTDRTTGNTYVFSFYREPALEYETHGNKVYSRLSRVCKNDTGDSSKSDKLATFIKARVNCSLPDLLLPFYYDLIQDVIWKEDTEEVYAVFTSQELGPAASALCRYRMEDIMKLFNEGKFKDQAGQVPTKLWLPLDADPVPRPGTCENVHSVSYPPLLDKLVPNYNPIDLAATSTDFLPTSALPTLYINGLRFTSLTADFQGDKCVFFFGTTTGVILKAYKDDCSSATEPFKAVKLKFMSEAVNGVGLLNDSDTNVLVVAGANGLLDWPITDNCGLAGIESECNTVFGPYGNWNGSWCVDPSGNPRDGSPKSAIVQPVEKSVKVCGMDKIVLYCEFDYGVFNTEQLNVSWTKTDNATFIENSKHLVRLTRYSSSLLEMEVTVIKNVSDGSYSCSSNHGTSSTFKAVEIEHEDCLTEDNLEERCGLHKTLETESKKINEEFKDGENCSLDVKSCDTCPHGSTTP
ncbi:semaphorin-1A-like [Asterias rubens]|uniref:semaphorin-1A-like n=1 Tax=Asterias rubens TaxID=7604 RepID=UPI0014551D7D|nr:semaphorin-1A-like [Asterias rubens]